MSKREIKIGLFGAGNVGQHLLAAFRKAPNVNIVGLWNRHPGKWKAVASDIPVVDTPEQMPDADVYILALKDDVLEDFSMHLKGRNVLTVHTSGAMASDILQTERKGVFYPLQTFTSGSAVEWTTIPLLVWADDARDLQLLQDLAGRISNNVHVINDSQRAHLHVAAVFTANFTNVMMQIADKITDEAEIPYELLLPLAARNFENLLTNAPYDVLTGPARRGDRKTIEKHLRLLQENGFNDEAEIYRKITNWIIKAQSI